VLSQCVLRAQRVIRATFKYLGTNLKMEVCDALSQFDRVHVTVVHLRARVR
jgi:hypothetical protein